MSILINIDMPTNCVVCHERGIREIIDCQLIFSGCANCGRHPNCPLIDFDDIKAEIEAMYGATDSRTRGEKAQLYVNDGGVKVRCKECHCQTPIYADAYYKDETHAVEYAIEAWNRRVTDERDCD